MFPPCSRPTNPTFVTNNTSCRYPTNGRSQTQMPSNPRWGSSCQTQRKVAGHMEGLEENHVTTTIPTSVESLTHTRTEVVTYVTRLPTFIERRKTHLYGAGNSTQRPSKQFLAAEKHEVKLLQTSQIGFREECISCFPHKVQATSKLFEVQSGHGARHGIVPGITNSVCGAVYSWVEAATWFNIKYMITCATGTNKKPIRKCDAWIQTTTQNIGMKRSNLQGFPARTEYSCCKFCNKFKGPHHHIQNWTKKKRLTSTKPIFRNHALTKICNPKAWWWSGLRDDT